MKKIIIFEILTGFFGPILITNPFTTLSGFIFFYMVFILFSCDYIFYYRNIMSFIRSKGYSLLYGFSGNKRVQDSKWNYL